MSKLDGRLIIYMNRTNADDIAFEERVEVAAETLGVSKSALIRSALNFALDNVRDFGRTVWCRLLAGLTTWATVNQFHSALIRSD